MKTIVLKSMLMILALPIVAGAAQRESQWKVHDLSRPLPSIIRAGVTDSSPPSDAIVLFDGNDLSEWVFEKGGGDVKWKVQDGYMEVVPKSGSIQTRQSFGSCQLHVEWCTPDIIEKKAQARGNSGIFLMGRYELQVLDSYQKSLDEYDIPTYADGQAGAIYGQKPPLVNVCRKPCQWQSYDIIFYAPVFKNGKLVEPATITVFQNGTLIQYHWTIKGTTFHKKQPAYQPHAEKLPLKLQDHKSPVRFRNIWIRPL